MEPSSSKHLAVKLLRKQLVLPCGCSELLTLMCVNVILENENRVEKRDVQRKSVPVPYS